MKNKIRFLAMMLIGILLSVNQVWGAERVIFFNETFGTPTAATNVTSYEGWSETDVTYSGSAKVGIGTTHQCGLSGSSGSGYMYESSSSIKEFVVSGINTSGYTNIKLSINRKGGSTSARFTIAYSTNGTSYTNLYSNSSCSTGYANVTPEGNLPSSKNLYIKITNTATNYQLYFDDLILSGEPAAPACATPTSLTNGTITKNSAQVSWTSSESTFEVLCSTSSTDPASSATPTATVTAKTYTFMGLNANTTYYWWVRTKCSESSKSAWVKGTSFKTASITYTDYLTDCAATWDVTIAKNEDTWGTVSQASVTAVADQTTVSASSNVLTIGTTEVAATAAKQAAQYTYAFNNWTGIPVSGKITEDVTITANFTRTARTYSVKYNMNGGGWKEGEGVYTYTFGVGISALATTVDRTGYGFAGWYDNEGLTGDPVTSIPTDATGDKEFWAKWNVGWKFMYNGDSYAEHNVNSNLTYTVHLDGNTTYWFRFSDGADHAYKLPGGNTMTCSSCTNWEFGKDYSTDCGIATTAPGNYTFSIDDSDAAIKLLVSVTYPPSVLVTFDMNGHGTNTTTYIAPNTAVDQPSDPSAAGWDFAGWYTDAACSDGNEWNFTTTISANKTLYAKWIEARTTLYLDPGVWDRDGAKFAVYYFSTEGNGWSDLMTIAPCESSIYTTTIPKGYEKVDFVRLSNDATAGTWDKDKKWNQTSDIVLSDSWDKCRITDWGSGDSPCSTSKYSPTTFTVTCAVNPAGYGTVSQASVTSVPCGTSISATGSTLRVGSTTVTASPANPDVQYTYAFDHWDWTDDVTEVTSNITATAHFTHTLNQYTINALNLSNCVVADGSSWPTGKKDYGSSFSTTFVANEGYKLPSEISVTGATYTWSAGTLTITSVTGDVTVSIVAVEQTYVNYRTSCTTVTTVTLNKGDHGMANGSATIKLGTSTFSSWTGVVAAEHFDLIGYYDGDTKVIDANGTLFSNVSGWTTSDGKWDKDATTATLTAKFTQRTFTVTTSDIDEVTDHVVNEGETYTLPALSCATGDFTRVGWTTTAPTDNAWATRPTITEVGAAVSAAGTYYAVYGEGSGDPSKFVKVNSITDGAYVITSTEESPTIYAMKYTSKNNLAATSITETSTGVVTTTDPMLIWNVTVSGSAISLQTQNEGNKYIGINNEKTAFSRTDNLSRPWTVDWYNGKVSLNAGNDGDADVYLNYSETKFGLDYDNSNNLVFYKQEGSGLDYISNPVCCENKVEEPVVNAATKTHNSITLSWSNVDGATGYKVTINGDTHDVTTSSCSHTASGLTPDMEYSWTVVATWNPAGAYCGAIAANGTTTTNPVYTVTYVKAGGETGTVPTDANTYPQGGSVTVAGKNTLTYSGYDFAGWKCSQDDETYTEGETVMMGSDNMTFTAVWTPKTDTYFDDIHKTAGYTGDGHIEEGKYTVPTLEDDDGGSNSCETGHSVFVGWVAESSTNTDGTLKSGFTIVYGGTENKAANNIRYHAVWAESSK